MSPLGKITFAVIGLRFFGASGFFIGMFLGHLLVDRTIIIKFIEQKLSNIDDNIRLLLPYRWYRLYNRLDGNFWGKIWGAVLGSLLFGFYGFVTLFIAGHFLFDTPNSRHAQKFRKNFDIFWNQNLGKILGAIIGFVFKSRIILFSGIIIGFFIDLLRSDSSYYKIFSFHPISKFWRKINPIKLALHSMEARKVTFIQAIAGLSAKIAKADGVVSDNEVRVFKQLFEIPADENSKVAKIFNEAKSSSEDYQRYAEQLKKLSEKNLSLKESIIENLFKIAAADGTISSQSQEMLANIAVIIELPEGNFIAIKQHFEPRPCSSNTQDFYQVLGVFCNASDCEIKSRWKELLNIYHPDKLQARGASLIEIEETTLKMAEINNAYQNIMKSRKIT